MIFSEDPKEPDDYPCMLLSYLLTDKSLPDDIIGQPHQAEGDPEAPYNFLIGGVFYNFYVSKGYRPGYTPEGPINKKGEMRIFHIPRNKTEKFFRGYFGLHQAG